MIGSIDMLANISSMPVASMAITGPLSGIEANPVFCFEARDRRGRGASLIRKVVARNATKMMPPAARKVMRMPINGGRAPPISGPIRFPAMIPDDIIPSAQAVLARGVCVATRVIEPEE